ncbi:MAG: TonB-dependent receptor [Terriglobia bacterium]|jgi:hypothetical protein
MAGKKVAWICGLFVAFALAGPGYAQLNRGILEGTVTDPQGAFIPGVKVTVTAVDTNVVLPTTTNNAGYYRVVDLVPGTYQVHFEGSGFSPLDLTEIAVPPGQTIRADAALKIGTTRQTVEVSAALQMVQTAATDFSTTISTNALDQIPLQGRDLQQLVFLVPGVSGNGPPGSSFGFNSQYGSFPDPTHMQGSDISVNGGIGGTNAWYLDGNVNLSGQAESVIVNPSPDAVTEFAAITNGFSAEYGRSGGAVFSVVLKSGTNKLHGDVYEYVRNSYFNARNPFTSIGSNGQIIPQDALRYNDFGGTLGGPLVIPHLYNGRNKTFFFFSWDESILHINGSQVFSVPTPAEVGGNFSEDPNTAEYGIWDPSTTVGPAANGTFQRTAFGTPAAGYPNGCVNTVVAANPGVTTCNFATQLPTASLSSVAGFFMKSFPSPNYLNPLSNAPLAIGGAYRIASNYLAGVGSSQDGANISIKIDNQWSDKNRFFAEWLFNPGTYNNYRVPWTGATFPAGTFGFGSSLPFNYENQIIAFGNTYVFSPTLINEFRASYSRQYYTTHPKTAGYPSSDTDLSAVQAAIANSGIALSPLTAAPSWAVSSPGGGSMGWGPVGWTSNFTANESYTILDNVTKIMGKHTLRTGFMYRLSHVAMFQSSPTNLNFYGEGSVDPNTGLGGGSGLAQFMQGDVMSNGGLKSGASSYATSAWDPYARYRYWGFYIQDDFRVASNFTLNLGLRYDIFGSYQTRQFGGQVPDSKFCYTCPNSYTGMPGIDIFTGSPGWPNNSDYVSPNWGDFGPRVNFSWSPFADRKTVIRGGFDSFYSNGYSMMNSAQNIENQDGYAEDFIWDDSNNPNQCAPNQGECVAWTLNSTGAKGPLTTPVFTPSFPAQSRQQTYGAVLLGTQKPTHDPWVQSWTLEVQRELPGNMALTVGYVGQHGTHLSGNFYGTRNGDYVSTANRLKYENSINAVVPISSVYSGQTATALAQIWGSSSLPLSRLLLPYPAWSGVTPPVDFEGENIYHALDARLLKRLSHGLNFSVAYTWSKNIANPLAGQIIQTVIDPIHFARSGDVGGLTGALGGVGGNAYQNPDNIRADRALALNDMPQMLNITPSYELPFGLGKPFLNQKGPLNAILGNWRLMGTFNAESGVPLSITGPCDGLQSEIGVCRPNLVGNPRAVSGGQNINDWINAAAFTPSFGTNQSFWAHPDPTASNWWQFGDAGERLSGLRSPGFWGLDASLGKQFHLSETKYLDFRWEIFNALNHQNPGMPNLGYCLPPNTDGSTDLVHQAGCSFGRITNVQTDPRAMEFALKFLW